MPYRLSKDLDTPENNKWMEDCVSGVLDNNKDLNKSQAIAICKAKLQKGSKANIIAVVKKENAEKWTQAYQNELPNSSFAWIHPDYKSGKSEDKSLRKLPYKDKDGKIDKAHTVAAMAALMGARGGVDIPDGDRKGVYNKLKKAYDELGLEAPEFK